MPRFESSQEIRQRFFKLRDIMDAAEAHMNVKFLDIKEHPIGISGECKNQVMVIYKNGRFEVLPTGVCGNEVKDFLQLRFTRVIAWALLPTLFSSRHPWSISRQSLMQSRDTDIYECV